MINYKLIRKNYKTNSKCIKLDGYTFTPKIKLKGYKINQIKIFNNDIISLIIKRKIKYHLDLYLKFIIDNMDEEGNNDSQKTLLDLKKYSKFIYEKYFIYLDQKYLKLLKKRIKVIERELENNITYETQEEHRRSR